VWAQQSAATNCSKPCLLPRALLAHTETDTWFSFRAHIVPPGPLLPLLILLILLPLLRAHHHRAGQTGRPRRPSQPRRLAPFSGQSHIGTRVELRAPVVGGNVRSFVLVHLRPLATVPEVNRSRSGKQRRQKVETGPTVSNRAQWASGGQLQMESGTIMMTLIIITTNNNQFSPLTWANLQFQFQFQFQSRSTRSLFAP